MFARWPCAMTVPTRPARRFAGLALAALFASQPAHASSPEVRTAERAELPAYLQCVPYARQVSGIGIYGDAHTWWEQAAGRYRRGDRPEVGAVMAFAPHRAMQLGHVAAVSRVVDSRTVLLDHANWSPIGGRRGQVERDVTAVDVSPNNDWSLVRVWYAPLQGLGKTPWPVHGFIYGDGAAGQRSIPPVRMAVAKTPSRGFLKAFSGLGSAKGRPGYRPAPARAPAIARPSAAESRAYRTAPPIRTAAADTPRDPYASVLAKYD